MGEVFVGPYDKYPTMLLARIQALMHTGGMGLSRTDAFLQGHARIWSFVVTSTGDPIVACVTREDPNRKQMEFWSVVVHPDFRGKGLATDMLNYVKSKRPGYTFWLGVLFSNPSFTSAVKAYVKAGFTLHRLSTHTLLHTLTTDVPFLEMLTSPDVLNTPPIELYTTTIVHKTIKLPWRTLSELSLLSHTFENEVAGAMILGENNVYDNPLKLEDFTRWGDTSVRDVKNQNETLFVGLPSRTPYLTNFANTVLFHTHTQLYYDYYATLTELSADFPSVVDLLFALDTNQPCMVVSPQGIFIYQVAPCLSVVMLKASPDLKKVIYDAVSVLIEDFSRKIRFTRDTPYMQLGNTMRTPMLRDYHTSLTISSLSIPPEAATFLYTIINPEEPIFTIWIYTLSIPKTGYLTIDTHFPDALR